MEAPMSHDNPQATSTAEQSGTMPDHRFNATALERQSDTVSA